jgi:hypothetical protein
MVPETESFTLDPIRILGLKPIRKRFDVWKFSTIVTIVVDREAVDVRAHSFGHTGGNHRQVPTRGVGVLVRKAVTNPRTMNQQQVDRE